MNTEIKNKWVTALRSGEYKQARGSLVAVEDGERGYCCLGVLCQLAADEGVCEVTGTMFHTGEADYYSPNTSETVLPNSVMDWSGLNSFDPCVTFQGEASTHQVSLSALNDNRQLSFSQIADLIEEQL